MAIALGVAAFGETREDRVTVALKTYALEPAADVERTRPFGPLESVWYEALPSIPRICMPAI